MTRLAFLLVALLAAGHDAVRSDETVDRLAIARSSLQEYNTRITSIRASGIWVCQTSDAARQNAARGGSAVVDETPIDWRWLRSGSRYLLETGPMWFEDGTGAAQFASYDGRVVWQGNYTQTSAEQRPTCLPGTAMEACHQTCFWKRLDPAAYQSRNGR